MQNGNSLNGSSTAEPRTVTVNPVQAAAFALQFMPRAPHTHGEREAFDVAMMFLQAITTGQVVMAPGPQAQPQLLPGEKPAEATAQ